MIASVQMWVRVPSTMREAISDVAMVHGTTMADVITTALEEYMGRHFPDQAVVVRTRLPITIVPRETRQDQ